MDREQTFSVCRYYAHPEGRYEYVARDVAAVTAIGIAGSIVESCAVKVGRIVSVMITDDEDYCCWLWERGRGVVYPTENMRSESNVERRASR